jgi:hypothetical protein
MERLYLWGVGFVEREGEATVVFGSAGRRTASRVGVLGLTTLGEDFE